MDSAALLDLLGNENRRRILRLLARKPCYVTEISEYLSVSPKAVIDHLRKLEESGLVESRVDEQRRKYFSITRNLRLEVSVSPYTFGTKSAYPASPGFDISRCSHLSIEERATRSPDLELTELALELERLETLSNELSMAQRWVHARITEVMDSIAQGVHDTARMSEEGSDDGRFYAELLSAIANGTERTDEISHAVDASPELVEEALVQLATHGVVKRTNGGWRLAD